MSQIRDPRLRGIKELTQSPAASEVVNCVGPCPLLGKELSLCAFLAS